MTQSVKGIASRFQHHFIDQAYAEYTEGEHSVWLEVLKRNRGVRSTHQRWFPDAYLEGIEQMQLTERLPELAALNERLVPTGWRTVCVDGYIPSTVYVKLMSMRIFPIARAIRRPEHVDFAPAPDMVHDLLGHLPMLFCPQFRRYLERLAGVMNRATSNDIDQDFFDAVRDMAEKRSAVDLAQEVVVAADEHLRHVEQRLKTNATQATHLRRVYVWSVEFGMLGDPSDFRIHGAALLSSPGEFRHVCDDAPGLEPYGLNVIEHENEFSDPLDRYFMAENYEQLETVLSAYEARMGQTTNDVAVI